VGWVWQINDNKKNNVCTHRVFPYAFISGL
jgi:hypothetical protein